jgi:hypothetical protein
MVLSHLSTAMILTTTRRTPWRRVRSQALEVRTYFTYASVAAGYSPRLHAGEGKKKKKKKKKPKSKKMEQSDPPRTGLSKFFPDGVYPEGEIQPYKDE